MLGLAKYGIAHKGKVESETSASWVAKAMRATAQKWLHATQQLIFALIHWNLKQALERPFKLRRMLHAAREISQLI